MTRFLLKINLLIILILLPGCGSYDTLTMERRIRVSSGNGYEIQFNYREEQSPREKQVKRSFIQYKTTRKFKGGNLSGPEGVIIQKGISEAVHGNYTGAEFLFNQCGSMVTDGSIQNNLAVIYEASGRYDEAFTLYTKALLISPEEKTFRSNFLLFLNQNYNEAHETVKKRKKVE